MKKTDNDPLEKVIEAKVCRYARDKGVLTYKFTSPARRSVPDRIFILHNAVIFVEFKRKGAKPTEQQIREIKKIADKRVPVYVIDNIKDGKTLVDEWIKITSTTKVDT